MRTPAFCALVACACASPRGGAESTPDAPVEVVGGAPGGTSGGGVGGGGAGGGSQAGTGGSAGATRMDAAGLDAPTDLAGPVARLTLSFQGGQPHRHVVRAIAPSTRTFECDGSCVVDMPIGATAVLEASPSRFGRFGGWAGACTGTTTCKLTFDQDRAVTAQFSSFDQWQRQVGTQTAVAAVGDAVFVAGTFSGTARFGDQQRTALGGTDIFLASFAGTGELRWLKVFGTDQFEEAKGIVASSTGDLAIWGEGPPVGVDFGGKIARGPHYVATFSSGGELRSVFDHPQIRQVALRPTGGLFVLGFGGLNGFTSEGQMAGRVEILGNPLGALATSISGDVLLTLYLPPEGINFAGRHFASAGADDVMVVKYAFLNQIVWGVSLGSAGFESPRAIVEDSRGDVLVTGATTAALGTPGNPVNPPGRLDDVFVAKLARLDGALVWMKTHGGMEADSPLSIAVDAEGNALVGALFGGPATTPLSGTTLLRCRSADGTCQSFGSFVRPASLAPHSSGDLFVGGMGQLARLRLP